MSVCRSISPVGGLIEPVRGDGPAGIEAVNINAAC